VSPLLRLVLSAAFLRGNGVIHRTQKVIQGDDNGHVGRPCEVPCAQKPFRFEPLRVCVFITAVRGGGGGEWRTCAMRDDEPRPVPRWMSSKVVNDRGCVDGPRAGAHF